MKLKMHNCNTYPDDEYTIIVDGGIWNIKPKKGFEYIVLILMRNLQY